MKHQAELDFFTSILKKFHLPYHFITYPFDSVPDLDLGIRKLLNPETDFRSYMSFQLEDFVPNKIFYVFDKFNCNYILLRIPDCEKPAFLFIGPYLSAAVTTADIYAQAERLSIPSGLVSQIEVYFRNLVVITENNVLLSLVTTLGETLWGNIDNFTFEKVEQRSSSYSDYSSFVSIYEENDFPTFSAQIIEERYELENEFLQAVSQGQFLKAEQCIPPLKSINLEPRSAEPLRNSKNYTIILNTLLRKAAEMGSVHPFHIDALSSRFARRIELTNSDKEIELLQREMIHKYCLLVKNHSMKGYSLLVRKVLTQIDTNLTENLSLNTLASELNVNPSYLSTLFRKETGSTLTEYVNRKRIDRALLLLNTTNMQIQTVAQYCGISDVNYFTKLFKKLIGKTPKEYREGLFPRR